MKIRRVQSEDRSEWLRMRIALWPYHTIDEHEKGISELLAKTDREPVFVAERPDGGLCGFAEASIRENAPGCITSHVGYLEGWYVDIDMRRQRVGRKLVEMVENWARGQGCSEMASDCEIDNIVSLNAHKALGYSEVERLIHFQKSLDK